MMVTDHEEIEHLRLAERYLDGELPPEVSAAFADHVVDCEECWDRLQLAQIWRKTNHQLPEGHAHGFANGVPHFAHPQPEAQPEPAPYREDPADGYFADADFPEIHVVEPAEVVSTESKNGHKPRYKKDSWRKAGSEAKSLILLSAPRPWQIPTITRLAAALAVALEYIQHQQLEIERLTRDENSPRMTAMGQFISQFEPWHLVLLGALTALLLILMPTTYLLYEFQKVR